MMNTSSNPLVEQIINQANEKAETIISKARESANSIIAESDEKAESECQNEKRSFIARLDAISQYEASAKRNVDRIAELQAMDSAYNEVLESVREQFESLSGKEEFKPVLISWIAEGAIGLDKKEAKVAFSAKDPVDDQMLREAEEKVLEATGASVKLSLDSQRCRDIGVVISSLDGQTSFDNELSVRLRRYQKDIRKIVQEENARENNR